MPKKRLDAALITQTKLKRLLIKADTRENLLTANGFFSLECFMYVTEATQDNVSRNNSW